jgi:hypothetical protein
VFLWLRFAWMQRLAKAAGHAFARFTVGAVLTLGALLIARGTAELVAGAPLLVALAALLAWLVILLVVIRGVSSDDRCRTLWRRLRRAGRLVPYLYAVVLTFVAIIFFATLAFVLADHDVIEFDRGPIGSPADALDFFAWHMLDAIPGLDVTTTLRWGEPLGYSDAGVGALVLAFKIVVIVPIVAAFAGFWSYSRAARRPTSVHPQPGR